MSTFSCCQGIAVTPNSLHCLRRPCFLDSSTVKNLIFGNPFNFSYNFQGQYTLPVDANSPINHMNSHSVEDFDNLGVVVWVQDVNTKEILQSTTASIVANVEENIAASRLMIFPNPSSKDYTNLVIESSERGLFEIMIINTLGEIVLMDNISINKNLTQYQLDNSKLSNGMYNVIIQTPSIQSSKKLQILR